MNSDWKTFTVQDLIDQGMLSEPIDGNHGELHPKASDYTSSGIPFIMANDLKDGTIDFDNCNYISETTANSLRKGFAHPGDVLITHKATIGRTAIVPETYPRCVLTPQVTYYRPIKGIDNRYLKYYFDSSTFQAIFANWAGSGSTRAYLGIVAQHKLPIILPLLSTQQCIASILAVLDERIDVNKKINDNLEQQMATLFSHMFVEAETKDWRIGTISDLGNVVGGSTPSKAKPEYYTEHGIAWITPKDLSSDKSKFISHGENDITDLGLKNSSVVTMPAGTVLFSSRAPIGYIAIADGEVTTNQGFKSVIPKPEIGTPFVYYFLKHNLPTIEGMASGSTFKEVSGSTMKAVPVVIPTQNLITEFNNFCMPLFRQQRCLELENRQLAQMRDSLLPRLMSGQIDVSSVQLGC